MVLVVVVVFTMTRPYEFVMLYPFDTVVIPVILLRTVPALCVCFVSIAL